MQTDQQIIKPQRSELRQMPQQIQALSPAPHSHPRLFPVALLALAEAALFTVGTIAVRTSDPLLPRLAKRSQNVSSRLAFYVQLKQWKADLHTLVSAVEYVAWPAESPGAMPPATSSVAYAPDSTLPNS